MINHARTLLINASGPSVFSGRYYAEEYIPSDFVSVSLPTTLQAVRNTLFGTDPDRDMLNYRARQYMNLLHATPLEQFVRDLDNRVTYDFTNADLFPRTLFEPTFDQFAGATGDITFVGDVGPPTQVGRMLREWDVSVTSGDVVKITLRNPRVVRDEAYTTSSGISSVVPLPGTAMGVRFPPTVSAEWRIRSYARPNIDMGSVTEALKALGDETLADLFNRIRPAGSTEPFKTFDNLWKHHPELPYKLGGAVLALVYRTEELR